MLDRSVKILIGYSLYVGRLENLLSRIYYLKFNISFLLFPVLCLLSCSNTLDKQTLITYINDPDNGLRKENVVGDYKISLTYKPTDLLVEQELGSDTSLSEALIEEKRNQYDKYNYFTLYMSAGDKDMLYSGAAGDGNYSEMVTKINFRLSEYIYAVEDNKDTLALADYYIPNLYGMGGRTQILLAFEKNKEKNTNKELAIKIKELGFGIGEQQFVYNKKDMEGIPNLKLSTIL